MEEYDYILLNLEVKQDFQHGGYNKVDYILPLSIAGQQSNRQRLVEGKDFLLNLANNTKMRGRPQAEYDCSIILGIKDGQLIIRQYWLKLLVKVYLPIVGSKITFH